MNIISLSESKAIQLDILSYIDNFCAINNITYSIAYGTLLGASRHKGFIPWDDDIDICMPRNDYEKFVNLFFQADTGVYRLGEFSVTEYWPLPFAKVYDNRTALVHNNAKAAKMGVFIDIFPFDKVNPRKRQFSKSIRRRNIYKQISQIKIARLRVNNRWVDNAFKLLINKIIFLLVPLRRIIKSWVKLSKRQNEDQTSYCSDFCIGLMKEPLPVSIFESIEDYNFEDRQFKGFKEYDLVLKSLYGDYMTPPPEKERINKHDYYAYWK